MARFVFRLDLPLRLARTRRSQARRELALLLRRLLDAEEGLRRAEAEVELAKAAFSSQLSEGVAGSVLPVLMAGVDAARDRLPELRQRVLDCQQKEREMRVTLMAASREVQVFERLRQEAYEEFVRQEDHKLQAQTDDIVLIRHGAKVIRERREGIAGR